MLTPEQIAAAQKRQVEALHELATHYVNSVQRLAALNMRLIQQNLDDANKHAQAVMDAKDTQEMLHAHQSVLEPLSHKASDYCRHLVEVATELGHNFTHVFQVHADEAHKQFVANVDEALKNVPPGSEAAVNAVKAAVANTKIVADAVRAAVEKTNKPQ